MKKQDYERLKTLKNKAKKGEKLTFSERNYLNMQAKKKTKR